MTTLINEHYIKPPNNIPIEKIHELFKIETQKEFKPWNFSLIKTYDRYIKPYRFAIIVFVVFGIFLLIKYNLKNSKKNKNKKIKKRTFKIQYDEPIIDDINNNVHNDLVSVDELKSLYSQDDEIINDDYLNNDIDNNQSLNETMKNEMKNIKNSKYMFNHLARLMTGSN